MVENAGPADCDVLVVGGGAAGCAAALAARENGARVILLDKGVFAHSGISGALPHWYCAAPADDADARSLVEDALRAGAGLADERALGIVARQARGWAERMEGWGALFRRDATGAPQALRSDGHAAARTRWPAYLWTVANQVRRDGIEVREERLATVLLDNGAGGVSGAVALRRRDAALEAYASKCVVIATGGGGAIFGGDMRVWQSSAPSECTGEGFALAMEAGAELVDMELIQTVMQPLSTEVEGDTLTGELVARARRQLLLATLAQAPAAHHFLGGIRVGEGGATGVPGLYACGDAAGGLFGAGRPEALALPACLAWGHAAGETAAREAGKRESVTARSQDARLRAQERRVACLLSGDGDGPRPHQLRHQLAQAMVSALLSPPDEAGLRAALASLTELRAGLAGARLLDRSPTFNQELAERLELDGMLVVAETVVRSALARRESRGVFRRTDYPVESDDFLGHVVARRVDAGVEVEFQPLPRGASGE